MGASFRDPLAEYVGGLQRKVQEGKGGTWGDLGHNVAERAGQAWDGAADGAHWLWNGVKKVGDVAAGGLFRGGDWLLHHGGQLVLDGAGFIPGVNVITEGIQSAYHGAHAAYDVHKGDTESAKAEGAEAAWHGGLAALNLFTGEGGAAAHAGVEAAGEGAHVAEEGGGLARRVIECGEHLRDGIQERVGIGSTIPKVTSEAVHNVHQAADIAELGWDSAATAVQALSGDPESVPFLGALGPWLSKAAHGGDGEAEKRE